MARDGAMRCDASARTRRVVLLVASLGVASAAWAGAEGFPAVSAAEQAERDARRVAILQGELASETAALARAETRRAEDPVVIEKILAHLNAKAAEAQASRPLPWRAPPRGAREA